MQPGRTHRHPRYEEGNLGCMTSQLLIGAKRWEPSGSSLGHCGNNALPIITRTARYHITYTKKGASTPLNARLHVWCPRRDSKGLRFAKPRASGARRPRHAPLQTGHRPVCLTLRALTRVRHEKGSLDPLERSLACMVPEARLELARCCQRWILSPLRLPIPPLGHVMRELVYHSLLSISPKMELQAFR